MFEPKDGDFASLITKLDAQSLQKLDEERRRSIKDHAEHSQSLSPSEKGASPIPPADPDPYRIAQKSEKKGVVYTRRRHSAPKAAATNQALFSNTPEKLNQTVFQKSPRKRGGVLQFFGPVIVFFVIAAVVMGPDLIEEGADPMFLVFIAAAMGIIILGLIGNLKKQQKKQE